MDKEKEAKVHEAIDKMVGKKDYNNLLTVIEEWEK